MPSSTPAENLTKVWKHEAKRVKPNLAFERDAAKARHPSILRWAFPYHSALNSGYNSYYFYGDISHGKSTRITRSRSPETNFR